MPLTALYVPASPRQLYDGFEGDWMNQPWVLPRRDGTLFPARLGHDVQPLEQAAEWLDKADFQQLLRDVRAQVHDWSGQSDLAYLGTAGLHLHYVREGNNLWVLAAGERQPSRFQTFLHGLWQVPPAH